MVDALAIEDDEGRDEQRYASGSSKYASIRRFPNGGTHLQLCASILEWINSSSEDNPANWNILVAGGKERNSITLVVASETVIAQTSLWTGVVGHYIRSYKISW